MFGSGPKIQSYDPFLSLLSSFRNHLKGASLFVTIGYSFQDKYINNILIQSLSAGVNRQLLVVDPAVPNDKLKFIKRVEGFQSSRSLTDIINLTKISPEKVEFEPLTAKEFFGNYLANGCELLKEKLESIETGTNVF